MCIETTILIKHPSSKPKHSTLPTLLAEQVKHLLFCEALKLFFSISTLNFVSA